MTLRPLPHRAGEEAPPTWLARVVATARARFPGASMTADVVADLLPHLTTIWRSGGTPELAVQTLCKCDGKRIVPTERVQRVDARPPRGAKRGEAFGADALREAPTRKPRKPAAPRAPRGGACPADLDACRLGMMGGIGGLPAVLVLAAVRGAPIPRTARYCLTSADNLIPSHVPTAGFKPHPKYPEEVQERDYRRDKGEQIKVLSIAQNMIPELIFNGAPGAIDGLPVVTQGGIVLGGNGRTMAIQLHYAQGGHVAEDYLRDHGQQFGFSRAQVATVSHPAIVRVIETPDAGEKGFRRALQELVRLLNIPLTQALDVRSESVAEARRLTDEILEILAVALADPDASLREYLSGRQSRALADALRRAGILTDSNAKRLLSGDGFSDDGKTFVERLLTAALVPDAELLEEAGGAMRGTLARSAPWILAAAAGGEGWDLRPVLRAALRDYVDLRATGSPTVDAYLRQTRLDAPPAVLSVPMGPDVLALLADVASRPTAFARFARRYAELSAAHPTAQGGLFASEKVSPQQAFVQAKKTIT